MAEPKTPTYFPDEVLLQILGYLKSDSPVAENLTRDPTAFFRNPQTPLKNASLVSRSWRRCAIRHLFKHVSWKFDRYYIPTPREGQEDISDELELVTFLRRNNYAESVESITLIIDPPAESHGLRYRDGQYWGLLPEAMAKDNWATLYDGPQPRMPQPSELRPHYVMFWRSLFSSVEPLRLTIVAPPDIHNMLFCLAVRPALNDLATRLHVLSVSREDRSNGLRHKPDPASNGFLFGVRPWDSLLINEGFQLLKDQPIPGFDLPHATPRSNDFLLGALRADRNEDCPLFSIRSLAYIGPFATMDRLNIVFLRYLESLAHVTLKFMPDSDNYPDYCEPFESRRYWRGAIREYALQTAGCIRFYIQPEFRRELSLITLLDSKVADRFPALLAQTGQWGFEWTCPLNDNQNFIRRR